MNYIMTEQEKNEYLIYKSPRDILKNMYSEFADEEKALLRVNEASVLIAGGMIGFDKGISHFLNEWYKKNENLFLLSEVTAENRRKTKERIIFPYICTPHLLAKEIVILGMDVPVKQEIRKKCDAIYYLKQAKENFEKRYDNKLGHGYAYNFVWSSYIYLDNLLSILKPSKVIMWNEFYPFHTILKGICLENKIPLEYMEFGCIPGTFCIEKKGQQGESIPARFSYVYELIPVKKKEIQTTKKIIEYIVKNKLNRNVQPKCLMGDISLKYFMAHRKTIVFYGHNEYESGIFPYTLFSKKYHSPIFTDSLDALSYLVVLAKKNNWNIIFKPHPTMINLGFYKDFEMEGVDIVYNVDINDLIDFADVNITILSQVGYISAIRNKPTVMMGYTQLKNKKCVYEVYKKKGIEGIIKKAIRLGCTRNQKENMSRHCAKLLNLYLYDDLTHSEFPFGKKIEERGY